MIPGTLYQAGWRRQARPRYVFARAWAIAVGGTLLVLGLYLVAYWRTFPAAQTDIGGDYAYAAWQMSQGALLYHDVLGQQTPLLYLLGALIYHLWPRPEAFLALALSLRAATVIVIFAIARSARLAPLGAAGAAAIYLLLPMGFVFGAHFEPNVLITLAGALCTLCLTTLSPCRVVFAGGLCGLAIMTKLTFIPIALALAAYILLTRRQLLRPFSLALCGTVLVMAAAGLVLVGGEFIQSAFLAHAGSTLSLQNLAVSMRYVWRVEGLTVLAAAGGALMGIRHGGPRRLLAFYLAGGLMMLGVTVSVGSLAPEMLAAEPAVALCAVFAVDDAVATWFLHQRSRATYVRLLPFVALIIMGQLQALRDDRLLLDSNSPSSTVACMARVLQRTHAPVIAPAYAAFLAQRPLAEGLSDLFNWSIRIHRGDPAAMAQEGALIRSLTARKIALVAFDDDHPLPPAVERAVRASYSLATVCGGQRVFASPAVRG